MAIEYFLQKNYLTPESDDYIPRVIVINTLYSKDIIEDARKRKPQYSEGEFQSILDVYFESLLDRVGEGYGVSTDLFIVKPAFEGTVKEETGSVDTKVNNLVINISISPKAIAHIQGAASKKINKGEPVPLLIQFFDATTKTNNSKVTSKGASQLIGEKMKFYEADEVEGLFFVNKETNVAIRVSVYLSITNGKISFQTPELTAGEYILELRKKYGTTNIVVRTGRLNVLLTAV